MNKQQIKTMDELTIINQNSQSNLSHTRTTVALTDQKAISRIGLEIRELQASNNASMITEQEIRVIMQESQAEVPTLEEVTQEDQIEQDSTKTTLMRMITTTTDLTTREEGTKAAEKTVSTSLEQSGATALTQQTVTLK